MFLCAERAEAVYKGEFTYAQNKPGSVTNSYESSGIYMVISTLIIMAIGIVWLLLERRTYCSKFIEQGTRYSLRDACENERTHAELALGYYNYFFDMTIDGGREYLRQRGHQVGKGHNKESVTNECVRTRMSEIMSGKVNAKFEGLTRVNTAKSSKYGK